MRRLVKKQPLNATQQVVIVIGVLSIVALGIGLGALIDETTNRASHEYVQNAIRKALTPHAPPPPPFPSGSYPPTPSGAVPDYHQEIFNKCAYPIRIVSAANVRGTVYTTYDKIVQANSHATYTISKCVTIPGQRTYAYGFDTSGLSISNGAIRDADMQSFCNDIQAAGTDLTKYAYAKHDGDPDQRGQNIETTFYGASHVGGVFGYNVDLSDVDYYILPVKMEPIYQSASPTKDATCNNRFNAFQPTQFSCTPEHGGQWVEYPAGTTYPNGPTGYCSSPVQTCAVTCPPGDACAAVVNQICTTYDSELNALYAFLNALFVNGAPWSSGVTFPTTAQMYRCDGFQNYGSPTTFTRLGDSFNGAITMTDMCRGINRGVCALPTADEMSTLAKFAAYANACGTASDVTHQQWFPDHTGDSKTYIVNPYNKWVHTTMMSKAYGFPQDEGTVSNTGTMACTTANGNDRPYGMRYTFCPDASTLEWLD